MPGNKIKSLESEQLSRNIILGLIRPKVSISKGFGLFQQLHYNLTLHFTLTDSSDLISFSGTSRPRALGDMETSLYRGILGEGFLSIA